MALKVLKFSVGLSQMQYIFLTKLCATNQDCSFLLDIGSQLLLRRLGDIYNCKPKKKIMRPEGRIPTALCTIAWELLWEATGTHRKDDYSPLVPLIVSNLNSFSLLPPDDTLNNFLFKSSMDLQRRKLDILQIYV